MENTGIRSRFSQVVTLFYCGMRIHRELVVAENNNIYELSIWRKKGWSARFTLQHPSQYVEKNSD